jgi:hypothetical protein
VEQWKQQFLHWGQIPEGNIVRFTSKHKEWFKKPDDPGVLITTYSIIGMAKERAASETAAMMDKIQVRY